MPEQLDVWAVGNDGQVWTSWWNRAANLGQWNAWGMLRGQPPDGFPAGGR